MRILTRPIYLASVVAVFAFIVYLQTMAPSVGFIDDGELATVCYTLGIAHPTGYPLFTLIGWLMAHLPLATSVIASLNVMAAIFTAAGAGMLVLVAQELFEHWMPERAARVTKSSKTSLRTERRRSEAIPKGSAKRPGSGWGVKAPPRAL
jgi:hypothetical protein